MPKQKVNRWLLRNQRIRAENDFNRIMSEYVTYKYGPIATEVCTFYDQLRDKYPTKNFYKGSRGFKTWVRKQIEEYVDEHPSSGNEKETEPSSDEQVAESVDGNEKETEHVESVDGNEKETEPVVDDVLSQLVRETVVDEVQAAAFLPPSINEEQQQQLNELDSIVNQIIADLEAAQDEGIEMDPVQDLECDEELNIPIDVEEATEAELDKDPLVEWW